MASFPSDDVVLSLGGLKTTKSEEGQDIRGSAFSRLFLIGDTLGGHEGDEGLSD